MLTVATEDELNELAAGRPSGAPVAWMARRENPKLAPGLTAVLWRSVGRTAQTARPLVLVSREEDQKRLFARFAQLRSDLSPLSTWCHFASPRMFEALDGPTRDVDLGGYEASWAGLVVAETLLLAERPVSKLRLPGCLATQSFAVARAHGLWGRTMARDALERFDATQRLFRAGGARVSRLREALEPIWAALAAVGGGLLDTRQLGPVVDCLQMLGEARTRGLPDEPEAVGRKLRAALPEAEALYGFASASPEQRLKTFDLAADAHAQLSPADGSGRRTALAFLAAYVATIAAGGAPTLSLAEARSHSAPEILLWAYVLGGVGERVIWTSSFDGLGRLVVRELVRPFRADEPPTCDIGLDEAQVLVDAQLADPFVHLRLKQARVVSVALLPGVSISVAISEGPPDPSHARPDAGPSGAVAGAPRGTRGGDDVVAALADALWPQIERRVSAMLDGTSQGRETKARSRQRNIGSQRHLQFKSEAKPRRD